MIVLTSDGNQIYHKLETNEIVVNDEKFVFDVPSQVINGRTLGPLRAIAETMGAKVEWEEKTNSVTIEKSYENKAAYEMTKKIIGAFGQDGVNAKPEHYRRYVEFAQKNPSMDIAEVIRTVNLNLDIPTYVGYGPDEEVSKATFAEKYNTLTEENWPYTLINPYNRLVPYNYETKTGYTPDNLTIIHREAPEQRLGEVDAPLEINERTCEVIERMNAKIRELTGFDIRITRGWADYFVDKARYNGDYSMARYVFGSEQGFIFADTMLSVPQFNDMVTGKTALLLCNESDLRFYYAAENNVQLPGDTLLYDIFLKDKYQLYRQIAGLIQELSCEEGLVVRYPEGKKHITGKQNPFIVSDVGKEIAQIMKDNNWCLEEFAAYFCRSDYEFDVQAANRVIHNL